MLKIKICEECGKEFQPRTGTQRYCIGPHHTICVICGKDIEYTCSPKEKPKTCSIECQTVLRKQTCRNKYGVENVAQVAEFAKKISLVKHGQEVEKPQKERKTKYCLICGKPFHPSGTQVYCGGPHYSPCPICGKPVEYNRPEEAGKTCSSECREELFRRSTAKNMKVCEICGKEFKATSSMSRYCKGPHYSKCPICGKEFQIYGVEQINTCCSKNCTKELRRRTCQEKYGVDVASQATETRDKLRESAILSEDKRRATCLEKYGETNPAKNPEVKAKIREAVKSDECRDKTKQTVLYRYGVEYAMNSPALRKKQNRNKKNRSSLEVRLHNFLNSYGVEFEPEYVIKGENFTHSFDVFLPKYKLLIDCDGVFFHGYTEDADGKWVNEDYDYLRLQCIPKGYDFLVIVESDFERGLRQLQRILEKKDAGIFDQDTEIFKWCRSIGFPYPRYDEDRLRNEWARLKIYVTEDFTPRCRIGMSIVNHFHMSMWDCRVGKNPTPLEAWYDDELLKKVIANRLIYQNTVNPSKVLQGFNISKIAPKVSVFNPAFARYLTLKYLDDCDTVLDPFSGFSGRMLGVCSTGRSYEGRDIREETIRESIEIAKFLNLDRVTLMQRDIFQDYPDYNPRMLASYDFDALFTCPPYDSKEIYSEGQVMQSCDDWIVACMSRYYCRKNLFVVDKTEKYKNFIVEEISDPSHFRKSKEYVVLIDRS